MKEIRSSVDRLIALSEARDEHIQSMRSDITSLRSEVSAMRPTVQAVADTLTFAKIGRRFVIGLAALGSGAVALIAWLSNNIDMLKKVFMVR